MEKKTIGKFIAALRKANGMTQKELGEKLYVSDKSVSRWECDECTPELSLIPSIAEIFGISTDELLRGERNNPDRSVSDLQEAASKQKAKSDKQFKLMLHNRKKKFTNFSFISIGLIITGLIAAMICNVGFSRGFLGFCLASIFFVAAAICQICFTVSFRLLVDEEDAQHAEEIKKANTEMVLRSVKIFFGILLLFAFCLPIAVLTLEYFNSYYGLLLDSWLLFGALFAAVAFLIGFCTYKIFVLPKLITKEIIWLGEPAAGKVNTDSRLLKKICTVFIVASAVIMLVTYIVTSSVSESTFIKRERFDNPDDFIAYMQEAYDAWYEEGYGEAPPPPMVEEMQPSYEPNKEWAEIDGKKYYYNPFLYESIRIHQYEDGEWEIVVTTEEADQNGQDMYAWLNMGLLSLHFINLAVCILWYLADTRKRKV